MTEFDANVREIERFYNNRVLPNRPRVAKGTPKAQPLAIVKPVDPRAEADRLFALVATATGVIFPKGVPNDRIIEVAEWQTETMRMLQR